MADNVNVSGPVEIRSPSREAVAFDLMKWIASHEEEKEARKKRDYWITLFRQCHRASGSAALKAILEKDPSI